VMAPNKWHPPIMAARILPHWVRQLVNYVVTGTYYQDMFPTYYRANTIGSLRDAGTAAGLVPLKIEYVSNHPQYCMFSVSAYRLATLIEKRLLRQNRFAWLRERIIGHFVQPKAC